jgi:uroporphyrinogen-III synthase
MRALVTRPTEDALITANALIQLGIEPLLFPLLDIRYHPDAAAALGACLLQKTNALVVVTSMHAVRALAASSPARDYPLWVVGAHTAERACALGFAKVRYVGENVAELIHTITHERKSTDGTIYYSSSNHIAYPLAETLACHGFDVEQHVVYDAIAVQSMDTSILAALQDAHPIAALFFSERSAAIFCNLLRPYQHAPWLSTLIPLALSQKIADTLAILFPRHVTHIASHPTQVAMLEMAQALDASSVNAE